MRVRFMLLLLLTCGISFAAPPSGYYASAQGKVGSELRQALHAIVRNHVVIPYTSSSLDTSDALKALDEDPVNTNNVFLLYAQRSEPKATFGLSTGWNREHLWPNSYGLDDIEPAFSDLYNLRAEDANANSARGNKFYDASDTNSASYRFPAHIEAPLCSTDVDSWEPPPSVKGDIARALFYMDVRYEGTSGEPDLILTGNTAVINATNAFMGRLSTLLAWHYADPVSEAERRRMEIIFERFQHNRNPFVDHPEWVDEVFRPRLRIVCIPGQVEISWEVAFSNAVPEVNSGSGWTGIGFGPVRINDEWISQPLAVGRVI